MSLGVLLGLIQLPIPGIGSVSMGVAGGPLVVGLVLGKLGRTGPLASNGIAYLAIATGVIVAAMAVTFLVTQYVLRMATDDLLGVVSGVTGNPATLVYANKVVTSDRIAAASATTFSSMTILKILCAQVALALL